MICYFQYRRYLYDDVVAEGLELIYGFIDPCYLGYFPHLGQSKERDDGILGEAKRNCVDVMRIQPNRRCYFMPMLLQYICPIILHKKNAYIVYVMFE